MLAHVRTFVDTAVKSEKTGRVIVTTRVRERGSTRRGYLDYARLSRAGCGSIRRRHQPVHVHLAQFSRVTSAALVNAASAFAGVMVPIAVCACSFRISFAT